MIAPTRALLVLSVALLGGATACADGPTEPEDQLVPVVRVASTSVERGASIMLRLENRAPRELRYNLCSGGRLQRLDGARWVDAWESFALCTPVLYPLLRGSNAEEEFYVPLGIPTGIHRVRVMFADADTTLLAYSNAFSVR